MDGTPRGGMRAEENLLPKWSPGSRWQTPPWLPSPDSTDPPWKPSPGWWPVLVDTPPTLNRAALQTRPPHSLEQASPSTPGLQRGLGPGSLVLISKAKRRICSQTCSGPARRAHAVPSPGLQTHPQCSSTRSRERTVALGESGTQRARRTRPAYSNPSGVRHRALRCLVSSALQSGEVGPSIPTLQRRKWMLRTR